MQQKKKLMQVVFFNVYVIYDGQWTIKNSAIIGYTSKLKIRNTP